MLEEELEETRVLHDARRLRRSGLHSAAWALAVALSVERAQVSVQLCDSERPQEGHLEQREQRLRRVEHLCRTKVKMDSIEANEEEPKQTGR